MSMTYLAASGKGGVGKSTLIANLAASLAREGKSVVLIDTDLGLRSQDLMLGLENSVVYDLTDAASGKCRLEQALLEVPGYSSLRLLPAAQFARAKELDPRKLKKMVDDLRKANDFILIDCPAGLERGLRNVLNAGTKMQTLLIVTPDDLSIRDGERVISLTEEKKLPRPKLIVNRLQNDLIYRGDMYSAQTVANYLDIQLLGEIPEDSAFCVAQLHHRLAIDYQCEAGEALLRIAKRMQGAETVFPEYGKRKTPFLRRHFPKALREVKTV